MSQLDWAQATASISTSSSRSPDSVPANAFSPLHVAAEPPINATELSQGFNAAYEHAALDFGVLAPPPAFPPVAAASLKRSADGDESNQDLKLSNARMPKKPKPRPPAPEGAIVADKSCAVCRSRKVRCNRIVPRCDHCTTRNEDCDLKDWRPKPKIKPTDPARVAALEARLAELEEQLARGQSHDIPADAFVFPAHVNEFSPTNAIANNHFATRTGLAEPRAIGHRSLDWRLAEPHMAPEDELDHPNAPLLSAGTRRQNACQVLLDKAYDSNHQQGISETATVENLAALLSILQLALFTEMFVRFSHGGPLRSLMGPLHQSPAKIASLTPRAVVQIVAPSLGAAQPPEERGSSIMQVWSIIRLDRDLLDLLDIVHVHLATPAARDLEPAIQAESLSRVRKALRRRAYYLKCYVAGADVHMTFHELYQLELLPEWTKLALQRVGDIGGPLSAEEEVNEVELGWFIEGLQHSCYYHPLSESRLFELAPHFDPLLRLDLSPQLAHLALPLPSTPQRAAAASPQLAARADALPLPPIPPIDPLLPFPSPPTSQLPPPPLGFSPYLNTPASPLQSEPSAPHRSTSALSLPSLFDFNPLLPVQSDEPGHGAADSNSVGVGAIHGSAESEWTFGESSIGAGGLF
ncbi:hypothetical protein Rhopal_002280-T1 [Rhodotorula paludigena]|uniref:Zn(2)-C6 fungal-type domain-containing protein n=1 Tax=Rhodotorula paludigena TaxID=86838 RepID=A0AAV5G9T3_9BASI|nr:hypothetical protein Rhopal_002280-T1 [Rhodotorula paludigena]